MARQRRRAKTDEIGRRGDSRARRAAGTGGNCVQGIICADKTILRVFGISGNGAHPGLLSGGRRQDRLREKVGLKNRSYIVRGVAADWRSHDLLRNPSADSTAAFAAITSS